MTIRKCIYLQGTNQEPSYAGVDDRTVTSSLLGGTPFSVALPGIGQISRGHGVLSGNSLKVTDNANNTVTVNFGIAAIKGTQSNTQGVYICALSTVETLTVPAAHATQLRQDYVIAQVLDNEYPQHTGDDWELQYLEGTPGSGVPDVPQDSLVLARITVNPGGSTVVTAEDISDLRPHARSSGSIVPVATVGSFPDPQEFDIVWEISTEMLKIFKDGVWRDLGVNYSADWKTAPGPHYDGSVNGGGSGLISSVKYIVYGTLVVGSTFLKLGDGGKLNSDLKFRPPVNARNLGANTRYMGAGYGRRNSNGTYFAVTCEMQPSFDNRLFFNFATGGTSAWNATNPFTWGAGDEISIFFMYEQA